MLNHRVVKIRIKHYNRVSEHINSVCTGVSIIKSIFCASPGSLKPCKKDLIASSNSIS